MRARHLAAHAGSLSAAHGRLRVVALSVVAAVGLVAPIASGAAPSAASSGPYGVGITRCTFVDTSRSVQDFATKPPSILAIRRVLVTEIRYPTAPTGSTPGEFAGSTPSEQPGGFPMIVFAHGYDVTPDTYKAMLDAWVTRGFVVAAPLFPDESASVVAEQHYADTEGDLLNEPADLAFVTRQILTDSAALSPACPLVDGLVRPSALALAGHSDGGEAVATLAYSAGRDPQGVPFTTLRHGLSYRAAIVMSGGEDGAGTFRAIPPSPALLVVQSAADRCNTPGNSVRLYRAVQQNDKWFLELVSAHHLPPFDGVDVAAFTSVVGVTTRFLQLELEGASTSGAVVSYGNHFPGVAQAFHAGSGPTIPPPTATVLCSLD